MQAGWIDLIFARVTARLYPRSPIEFRKQDATDFRTSAPFRDDGVLAAPASTLSTPPQLGRLLAAAASLALSGSASLMAQIVIQKYVGVVSGGMDAFIMYVISFSFIGGLGLGALVTGQFAARTAKLNAAWSGVEALSAVCRPSRRCTP